ncbi:MAG: hypothetical protein AAGC73_06710 [Verrucomicrobiota bacterium]
MNKVFDKLILVLAFLLLGGGITLYFLKSGGTSSDVVNELPSGGAYEAVESAPVAVASAEWPEAIEQEPGVLYDVFTPPEIFIDRDGRFVFEGYTIGPAKEWTIYLAALAQKPYRIQLEGYIEEDRSDASKTLLLLFDEEKGESLRGRVGDDKSDFEFKVLSFEIERVGNAATGSLRKIATATILDQRTGSEVVLTHGERLYEDEVSISILSDADPAFVAELAAVGDEFQEGEDRFILREINLEESSISVEKIVDGNADSEIKTLTERSSQDPEPDAEQAPEPAEIQTGFEGFFN